MNLREKTKKFEGKIFYLKLNEFKLLNKQISHI